jgi:hypothetical protein
MDRSVTLPAAKCALTDVIAPGNAALRLTGRKALPGLFLLVRREDRLAAEFDAIRFGVGPAARAVRSRMQRRSSFAATPSIAKMISAKVRGRIEVRFGQ